MAAGGPTLDASIVSDEAGRGEHGSFTGAFVGMVAFDTSGGGKPADFRLFFLSAGLIEAIRSPRRAPSSAP